MLCRVNMTLYNWMCVYIIGMQTCELRISRIINNEARSVQAISLLKKSV